MYRNLYNKEFKRTDKQLEAGTIIRMTSGYEHVILGFEEIGLTDVLCCYIEKNKYIKQQKNTRSKQKTRQKTHNRQNKM